MNSKRLALGAVFALGLVGCSGNNTYYISPDFGVVIPPSVAPCTPMAKDCANDRIARFCPADGQGWIALPCAANQKCMAGDCVLDVAGAPCNPGDGACSSATMALQCNSNGMGFKTVTCPANTQCVGTGQCFGTCTVGESRCDSQTVMSVCTDGVSFTQMPCPANNFCVGLTGSSPAQALCIAATVCQPDPRGCDTVCGDKLNAAADQTKATSTCTPTVGGFKWVVNHCAAPATCDPGAGVCGSMTAPSSQAACAQQCTPGTTRCGFAPAGPAGLQTCTTGGVWGTVAACSATTACFVPSGNNGNAVCGDPACDNGAAGVCVLDTDGTTKLRACGSDGKPAAALTSCAPGLCIPMGPPVGGQQPGACGPECNDGDQVCVAGTNSLQVCVGSTWSARTTDCAGDGGSDFCVSFFNDAGSPRAVCGVCTPGEKRCQGTGAGSSQTCGADGHWGTAVPCTVGTCSNGSCVAQCVPGRTLCLGPAAGGRAPTNFGSVAQGTCTASGAIPAAPTCPGGTGCCVPSGGEPTSCRTDQAGNSLGCVVCVGTKNENGLQDTRCTNDNGGLDGGVFRGIELCLANNSGWQAPPASQCVAPQSCNDPAPPTAQVLGTFCHTCNLPGGPVECTDTNLFNQVGIHCRDVGAMAVTCANGTSPGSVADCCSFACSSDPPPAPASCGG